MPIILGAGLPGVVLGASTILRAPKDPATFLPGLLAPGSHVAINQGWIKRSFESVTVLIGPTRMP